MSTLNEEELRDIINSDMKLWDKASTSQYPLPGGGTGVAKTLVLPYGIGEQTVVFPEVNGGAVETFGSTIRSMVDDVRGEAAIEAARIESQARRELEPVVEPAKQPVPEAEAVPASEDPYEAGAGLADRVAGLRGSINAATANVRRWTKELRAYEAALEILDAPEDDGAECESIPPEETRP